VTCAPISEEGKDTKDPFTHRIWGYHSQWRT